MSAGGAFFTAFWSIYRWGARSQFLLDSELRALQPYLLAGIAAYVLGMMTLSIGYLVPTFMMLAISVAYTQMASRACLAAADAVAL